MENFCLRSKSLLAGIRRLLFIYGTKGILKVWAFPVTGCLWCFRLAILGNMDRFYVLRRTFNILFIFNCCKWSITEPLLLMRSFPQSPSIHIMLSFALEKLFLRTQSKESEPKQPKCWQGWCLEPGLVALNPRATAAGWLQDSEQVSVFQNLSFSSI